MFTKYYYMIGGIDVAVSHLSLEELPAAAKYVVEKVLIEFLCAHTMCSQWLKIDCSIMHGFAVDDHAGATPTCALLEYVPQYCTHV